MYGDYDWSNEGNEGKKEKRSNRWIALGVFIGLLFGISLVAGYAYADEIADQLAQKCPGIMNISAYAKQMRQKYTDIMDILRAPIQIPQPGQGAAPVGDAIQVSIENANPPAVKQVTNVKTEWVGCQPTAKEATPVDPTANYAVVDIDVRLRDLNSEDFVWLDDAGVAEVGADQDVVVWVNLPDGIDKLNANYESSYPAKIKAGKTGTIEVSVVCYDNQTKYVGSLTISATDDLTLGTARRLTRNAYYDYFTVEHKYFAAVEDESRLHTHVTYALYTSCDADTEMYSQRNGVYSSDLSLRYNIREK